MTYALRRSAPVQTGIEDRDIFTIRATQIPGDHASRIQRFVPFRAQYPRERRHPSTE